MASALIGSLRVALGLDTAQFESGANKARAHAKQTATDIETSFKHAKTAVEGLFAALTVGFIADQIKKSLDYAGSLAEVSRTLGVTTKDLQTFRFAATQTGVAQDQLEVGLRRLTVSMGKAERGSKDQAKAFAAIGISVDQLKGKTTGDIFRLMADGLSKVTDRSQRAAIEMTLMGRSGSTLDNLLAPGARRLNELAQAAQQLGIVLSDHQIQSAEETAHKLEAVKQVLAAQIAGVVADNAAAILGFSNALAQLTGQIVRFLGSNPQLALGILGGLVGLRLGGIGGALAGGLGGVLLGAQVQQQNAESSTDIGFRRQQVQSALAEVRRLKNAPATTSTFSENGIPITTTANRTNEIRAANNALQHQVDLLNRAYALAKAANAPTPQGADLPKIFGGGGAKAKKPPRDKNEADEFEFAQQERQIELQILQQRRQLEGSAADRAALDLQMIKLEHDIQAAEIDHKVAQAQKDFAEHKITKDTLDEVTAQADILRAKNDELTQIKLKAFAEEQARIKQQAIFDALDQQKQFQIDALRTQDQLATTQADHRKIQLEILDAEIEEKRLRLQQNLELAKKNGATAEQLKIIQDQIDNLPNERAQGAAQINRSTQNPLEQWAQQVPKTASEINEALQSIEVKGLDGLSEALTGILTGTENLKDAFHQLALSVLQDLLQMTIEMLIFKALSSVLGSAFGGGGISNPGGLGGASFSGGFDPSALSAPAGSLPGGFATGGSFLVQGRGGTDQNLLSLNGLPIARVSHNERIGISAANDMGGPMMPPLSLAFHNDFRGADPAAVASISDKLERLKAAIPSMAVGAWIDAQQRFVVK